MMSKEFLKKLGIVGITFGLSASPLAFADFHEEDEQGQGTVPQETVPGEGGATGTTEGGAGAGAGAGVGEGAGAGGEMGTGAGAGGEMGTGAGAGDMGVGAESDDGFGNDTANDWEEENEEEETTADEWEEENEEEEWEDNGDSDQDW